MSENVGPSLLLVAVAAALFGGVLFARRLALRREPDRLYRWYLGTALVVTLVALTFIAVAPLLT